MDCWSRCHSDRDDRGGLRSSLSHAERYLTMKIKYGILVAASFLVGSSLAQNQQPGPECWEDAGPPQGCRPPAGEPPVCNPVRIIINNEMDCPSAYVTTSGYIKARTFALTCYYIYGHWQNGECVLSPQPHIYHILNCRDVRNQTPCG